MSGSGGGGGGGGGGTPTTNCASISAKVTLNSPDPKVIKTLKVGDELEVQLHGSAVVAVAASGHIAGSITFPGVAAFKKCLEQGHSYVATVVALHIGNCEVQIQYTP